MRPDHPLELPAADGRVEDRARRSPPAAPIVLKPAEQTPLTALRLGELALEAGLPAGRAQRRHRRRRDRRRAGRPPRRGQDRLHRLDRGRPRDRRQGRARAQARDARAGRQVAEHHPARRRPGGGDQGLLPGRSTSTPARPATPARGCSCPRTSSTTSSAALAERGAARRSWARASTRRPSSGPLVSAEQLERVTGYIESGQAEGAELVTGGGRRARRRRLLRRADAVHRHRRRPDDRARGDLRPGAGRAALRVARGGRRSAPTTPSTGSRPASGRATSGNAHRLAALLRGGHGLRQRLGPGRPGGAVRRLQGLGRRPRARPRRARAPTSRPRRSGPDSAEPSATYPHLRVDRPNPKHRRGGG